MTDEAPTLSNIAYDDLEVDNVLGPYTEPVPESLAGVVAGPIGTPMGATKVPPAVFPILFLKALRRSMGGIPSGSVLAKQELEFHAELPVDSTVRITTWISEKYIRRERPYVVIEFDIRDESDRQVLTGRKIIIWPTRPGE
jgi:allophanate hydrolase subunit 2